MYSAHNIPQASASTQERTKIMLLLQRGIKFFKLEPKIRNVQQTCVKNVVFRFCALHHVKDRIIEGTRSIEPFTIPHVGTVTRSLHVKITYFECIHSRLPVHHAKHVYNTILNTADVISDCLLTLCMPPTTLITKSTSITQR